MIFSYYHAAVLPNTVFWHNAAHTGYRIYITVTADNRTRIKHAVASHFNIITKDCTDFLATGLNALFSIVNSDQQLVRLYVGCNRACTHMALIAQDRVAYVVVMWHLHVIEQNDVLQFYQVADNTVRTYKRRASYISTVTNLRLQADNISKALFRLHIHLLFCSQASHPTLV